MITFFYGSIAAVWMVLLICTLKEPITFKYIMIAITGMGCSLLFDTSLGEYAGLYYYINKSDSLFYIIISSIFLYPVIEVIYAMLLPEKVKPAIIYTALWLVLMIAFELISLYIRTVVFTGWRLVPWSIATYLFTYGWINLLFRYMGKRGL